MQILYICSTKKNVVLVQLGSTEPQVELKELPAKTPSPSMGFWLATTCPAIAFALKAIGGSGSLLAGHLLGNNTTRSYTSVFTALLSFSTKCFLSPIVSCHRTPPSLAATSSDDSAHPDLLSECNLLGGGGGGGEGGCWPQSLTLFYRLGSQPQTYCMYAHVHTHTYKWL